MKIRNAKSEPKQRRERAFSLVEVMVAVGLLALIIVGLLAMFYQTQRAFRSSATQSDVLEGGRAVMQLIRQDLMDLHATDNTNVISFTSRDPLKGSTVVVALPPASAGDTLSFTNYDLSFLKRLNDVWTTVAYRVDGGNLGVGSLYRREEILDYLDTFDPYTDVQGSPPALVRASLNNANFTVPDASFHRVIDGVVHFAIALYDTNGVPYGNSFAVANGYLFTSNALPGYVDVELAVLEPKSLEHVRARSNNQVAVQDYLRNHADRIHLFKQRIAIRSRP